MNCPHCQTPNESGAMFCANCGTKLIVAQTAGFAQQAAGQASEQAAATNQNVEDVKAFFKNDMLKIVKAIFQEPIQGTRDIFTNAGTNAYKHALILIATTVIVFALVPYLMVGSEVRQFMNGALGLFLKFGLGVGLVLVIISALSFGIKSISGKPDFKKELLTGAMCGIPLMIMLLAVVLVSIFGGNSMQNFNVYSMMGQGVVSGIVGLYILLMLFNIVQQSFKASGTNDAMSWYLAPLVVCVGFYIGARIAMELFGGRMPGMF